MYLIKSKKICRYACILLLLCLNACSNSDEEQAATNTRPDDEILNILGVPSSASVPSQTPASAEDVPVAQAPGLQMEVEQPQFKDKDEQVESIQLDTVTSPLDF